MRSFVVRVYEDHYLVREEESPFGTHPVEFGNLEEALSPTAGTKATVATKVRRKRGKNKAKSGGEAMTPNLGHAAA